MSDPQQPAPRRRRRAVGPAGARPARSERFDSLVDPHGDDRPAPDDDERLRRDVPPHHGT